MLDVRSHPESAESDVASEAASQSSKSRSFPGRLAAGLVWAVGFVISALTWMPLNWKIMCVFGAVTAILFQRDRSLGAALRICRDWIGVLIFVTGYLLSRSAADTMGMPIREQGLIDIDRVLGFGEIPTHRLQRLIDWDQPAQWWEAAFSINYASHFVVGSSLLCVLYAVDRKRWGQFVRRWVLLGCIGVIGFILLPTVPPWLASDNGTIALVNPGLPRGWDAIKVSVIHDLFEFGADRANPIAAMPSLHAAYPALLFFFFAPGRSRLVQVGLAFYVLFMAFTIVITGQHWLIDAFAGWLCAWVAHTVIGRFEVWRAGVSEAARAASPAA